MTETATKTWHGMPIKEIEAGKKAPAEEKTIFKTVHFSGNYGSNLCQEFQSFTKHNIDQYEAEQIAWSAFGYCHHTITYYGPNPCDKDKKD